MEWVEVDPNEKRDETNMPDELKVDCPYCGVGYGFPCLTRNGEWAITHQKRLQLINKLS